jgi:hypothetical protein
MFLGHFAVGFAAKRVVPDVSLGILVAAATLLDLLWPVLLLLGWERVAIEPGNTVFTPLAFEHYPITHSLLAVLGWSVLSGGIYYAWTRRQRDAIVVGAVVLSHWLLDAVVHRPDLPLAPDMAYRVGIGLWDSFGATVLLESALFVTAIWLYARGNVSRDRIGRYAFWALLGFLALIFAGAAFGPPPPDARAVAFAGLAAWIFPFWAAWLDRHRQPRVGT